MIANQNADDKLVPARMKLCLWGATVTVSILHAADRSFVRSKPA